VSNPEFLKDDLSSYIGEKLAIDADVYEGYAEGEEGDYEDYDGEGEEGGDYDEGDDGGEFLMDADYLPGGDKFDPEDPRAKKRAAEDKKLTNVEGKDEAVDKLLEEYYHLNYEDFAGGKPTRFKYRKVQPSGYGLTAEEILLADDKDLNAFVSLKKLAP